MTDIVNLRRARKQAARKSKEREAEDNRVRFGMPAELRTLAATERRRAERTLSAARLDRPRNSDGPSETDAAPDLNADAASRGSNRDT